MHSRYRIGIVIILLILNTIAYKAQGLRPLKILPIRSAPLGLHLDPIEFSSVPSPRPRPPLYESIIRCALTLVCSAPLLLNLAAKADTLDRTLLPQLQQSQQTQISSSFTSPSSTTKASVFMSGIFRNIPVPSVPTDVINIMKLRYEEIRSGVTGEKINELRVGESLIARLRDIEKELGRIRFLLYL